MKRQARTGIKTSTLGCKVNYADTQAVVSLLPVDGDRPLEIVATCCVTAEGEKQSRKEARRAARRVGDDGVVIVTGCAARLKPDDFRRLADNVEVMTGSPSEIANAAARIAGIQGAPRTRVTREAERTRHFLKVQDGCGNRCAYCIVPLVRGRPASTCSHELAAQARAAVLSGCPEIVVSGIDVGAYDDGSVRLAGLIELLSNIDGLARLRLSSIEAIHLTPELLDVMGSRETIARHLHVPLQSGDDRILGAMKRRYGSREFARHIALARERLDGVNLTTDAIVGFPGEDEAAFRSTLELVERIGFSKVHVFPYSKRPETAAARMSGQVGPEEKRERSLRLRQLSDRLQRRHREGKLGRMSEVLLESRVGGGLTAGYSNDYTRYIVSGGMPGRVVMVMGESVTDAGVEGAVAEDG